MILVIDDLKIFPFPDDVEVIYARTLNDGFSRLWENRGSVDELWLDHDLGGEYTTREICLVLAELAFNDTPYPIDRIVVCSLNPVGVEWITSTLSPYYEIKRYYFDGRNANVETI